MISRICICCGEPFPYQAGEELENPNICAACSQMADETMEEPEFEWVGPVFVVEAQPDLEKGS